MTAHGEAASLLAEHPIPDKHGNPENFASACPMPGFSVMSGMVVVSLHERLTLASRTGSASKPPGPVRALADVNRPLAFYSHFAGILDGLHSISLRNNPPDFVIP